jgi:hypothetical protein
LIFLGRDLGRIKEKHSKNSTLCLIQKYKHKALREIVEEEEEEARKMEIFIC